MDDGGCGGDRSEWRSPSKGAHARRKKLTGLLSKTKRSGTVLPDVQGPSGSSKGKKKPKGLEVLAIFERKEKTRKRASDASRREKKSAERRQEGSPRKRKRAEAAGERIPPRVESGWETGTGDGGAPGGGKKKRRWTKREKKAVRDLKRDLDFQEYLTSLLPGEEL